MFTTYTGDRINSWLRMCVYHYDNEALYASFFLSGEDMKTLKYTVK